MPERLADLPRARFIVPLRGGRAIRKNRKNGLAALFAGFLFWGMGGSGGEFAAFFGGPVGLGGLAAAGDAEGVGGDVFGDGGAGGDVGAVAEFYGSDEDGIAANEDAVTDGGG